MSFFSALIAEISSNEILDWAVGKPLRILLILIAAGIISRFAKRALHEALVGVARSSLRNRLQQATTIGPLPDFPAEDPDITARAEQRIEAISSALQSLVAFIVYAAALLLILAEVEISLAPLLAGAGVAGLAIGFGAQSLVKDFFTGIFILLEDQYAVGDWVNLGEAEGEVEYVSIRTTRLRATDGAVWHIRNGEILRVANMSQHWARALIDVEVAYATDLERAKALLAQIGNEYAEAEEAVLEPAEVWGVESLGSNGVMLRMVVKTLPAEQWRVGRDLRERVKATFEAEGIEIPLPQQMVWNRDVAA